jgi:hypothetical protein
MQQGAVLMPSLKIRLPTKFNQVHEEAVIAYLDGALKGRKAWSLAFTAFDLLDGAILLQQGTEQTFRTLYRRIVEDSFADVYLHKLLALPDVKNQSPALWSHYARKIVAAFTDYGWERHDLPASRLLLSYLLYWWGAFARGYAFEVEIFQDLQKSNVQFQAHNLLNHDERFSLSDLTVNNLAGDIKTSVYFLQAAARPAHDFYIVRLYVKRKVYTFAVLLQPDAWNEINGDTIPGTLETVLNQWPQPVRIERRAYKFVVIEYTEWKRRILRLQEAKND